MTRTGPVPPQTDLPIRPCRDADCEQFQAVLSRSFHEMRVGFPDSMLEKPGAPRVRCLGVCGTIRGGISKKEPLKETARGN